jgi:hypothetical protein
MSNDELNAYSALSSSGSSSSSITSGSSVNRGLIGYFGDVGRVNGREGFEGIVELDVNIDGVGVVDVAFMRGGLVLEPLVGPQVGSLEGCGPLVGGLEL